MNFRNYTINKDGSIEGYYGMLKPSTGRNGYKSVTLCENGKRFCKYVHRLVAEKYLPNPKKLPCINHIDGNKLNNTIENLEWCDYTYNNRHARTTGLNKNKGELAARAKLSFREVVIIKKLLKEGISQRKIAYRFKVSKSCIQHIKERRSWNVHY